MSDNVVEVLLWLAVDEQRKQRQISKEKHKRLVH
jgi:hypothetical protein